MSIDKNKTRQTAAAEDDVTIIHLNWHQLKSIDTNWWLDYNLDQFIVLAHDGNGGAGCAGDGSGDVDRSIYLVPWNRGLKTGTQMPSRYIYLYQTLVLSLKWISERYTCGTPYHWP